MTGRRPRVISLVLVPGRPKPVDGLCIHCLTPSLVEVVHHLLQTAGVTRIVHRLCTDCRHGQPRTNQTRPEENR